MICQGLLFGGTSRIRAPARSIYRFPGFLCPLKRRTSPEGEERACRTRGVLALRQPFIALIAASRYNLPFPARGVGSCPNRQLSISSTPNTPGMRLFLAIHFSPKYQSRL